MLILYYILRFALSPFIFLFSLFSKSLKRQLCFEKEFPQKMGQYDYIFHVSSEGEWEQSLSVIEYASTKGKTLVMVTSPSLKKKISGDFKFEVCAFSSLSFGFIKIRKLSCKHFFMCRYDFFPELVHFSYKHKSTLLNTSFKSLEKSMWPQSLYLKWAYQSFDSFCLSSSDEINRSDSILAEKKFWVHDFRSNQILKRMKESKEKLSSHFSNKESFDHFIDSYDEKIILGNYWPSEYEYIEKAIDKIINQSGLVCIVPHKLDEANIKLIKKQMQKHGQSFVLNEKDDFSALEHKPCIVILNTKGVLCELYTYFDKVYVAGGYHKSVHSIFEPFYAGACAISCGPKTQRSTEYDYVKEVASSRIKSFSQKIDCFYESEHNISKDLDNNPSQILGEIFGESR